MSLDQLSARFERFEQIQFPGFPDAPILQEAYDELVEKGGQLTHVIQRLLAGEDADWRDVPTFDVDLAPALPASASAPTSGEPVDEEDAREFIRYRAEIDALIELLRQHLDRS